MHADNFKQRWLAEEQAAQMTGWDFSHIDDRCHTEPLPWDYTALAKLLLEPGVRVLDLDTGGGEVLLSLGHDPKLLAATENYPPNAELCRQKLPYLGVDFVQVDAAGHLPWPDQTFDVVLCRHGSYCPEEVFRVLKPGGYFLTQQVGEQNDRAFIDLLLPGTPPAYPGWNPETAAAALRRALFTIRLQKECFAPMTFSDVGALVWFAKVLPWEFPGFAVEPRLEQLERAQALLEQEGCLSGHAHRFLLLAQKPQFSADFEARPATAEDARAILDLYHACAAWGTIYGNSSWNTLYPAMEEIEADLALDGLFVMTCKKQIIAAISLIPHDDLDELDCWSDLLSCVPVRLGVHPHWQRSASRIAERMMVYICGIARQRGYQALRFLAAESNLPACRLYDTLACDKKGKTVMYGHEFLCYEKLL